MLHLLSPTTTPPPLTAISQISDTVSITLSVTGNHCSSSSFFTVNSKHWIHIRRVALLNLHYEKVNFRHWFEFDFWFSISISILKSWKCRLLQTWSSPSEWKTHRRIRIQRNDCEVINCCYRTLDLHVLIVLLFIKWQCSIHFSIRGSCKIVQFRISTNFCNAKFSDFLFVYCWADPFRRALEQCWFRWLATVIVAAFSLAPYLSVLVVTDCFSCNSF